MVFTYPIVKSILCTNYIYHQLFNIRGNWYSKNKSTRIIDIDSQWRVHSVAIINSIKKILSGLIQKHKSVISFWPIFNIYEIHCFKYIYHSRGFYLPRKLQFRQHIIVSSSIYILLGCISYLNQYHTIIFRNKDLWIHLELTKDI